MVREQVSSTPHPLSHPPACGQIVLYSNGPHVLVMYCIQFMNRVILIMEGLGWGICLSWPDWVR